MICSNDPSEVIAESFDGIDVSITPTKLLINNFTNKLYISGIEPYILVIDLKQDAVIKRLNFGQPIITMDLDPIRNMVYMVAANKSEIFIIDGKNDEVLRNISLMATPKEIAVDYRDNLLYVIYKNLPNISKIQMPRDLDLFKSSNIAVNNSNNIFVNPGTGDVYVLSTNDIYKLSSTYGNFPQQIINNIDKKNLTLINMDIDPINNLLYVTSYHGINDSSSLHVVKPPGLNRTSELYNSVATGKGIAFVSIDYLKNRSIVSSYNGDLSVQDNANRTVLHVNLDRGLVAGAIDPQSNIVYILKRETEPGKGTIYIIDANSLKPLYGLRLRIEPPNSGGSLICKVRDDDIQEVIQTKNTFYKRFHPNSWFDCYSSRITGIAVHDWNSDLTLNKKNMSAFEHSMYGPSKSTVQQVTFNLSKHGANLTTKFGESFTLSEKYANLASGISVGVLSLGAAIFSLHKRETHASFTDLITIDSAIIAGILILLSLQGIFEKEQQQISLLTMTILFPFVVSVIASLIFKKREDISANFAIAGCIQLSIAMILIIIISFTPRM